MSTRRTASTQKKGTMARKSTSARRGGSRGRRRSSSVFRRYPRWAWWIGGTAVVVLSTSSCFIISSSVLRDSAGVRSMATRFIPRVMRFMASTSPIIRVRLIGSA